MDKINFTDGQTLYASELNTLQDNIEASLDSGEWELINHILIPEDAEETNALTFN